MRGLNGQASGDKGPKGKSPKDEELKDGEPEGGVLKGRAHQGRPPRGKGLHGRGPLVLMSAGTVVLVGTVLVAAGYATGGTGLRDGGPALVKEVVVSSTPPTAPSPPRAAPGRPPGKVDPVALVMDDPKVSAAVKQDLKPCSGKEYPVDVSYGKITGGPSVDIVVNVLSCVDAMGRGSYVYRASEGSYENVFSDEQPPVYAEIDRDDLVLTKPVYGKNQVPYPSGEDVITYRWDGNGFGEQFRVHTDYSNVVDGGGEPAPAVTPEEQLTRR